AEIDSLLAAVTQEAKHRNRLPSNPTREKVLAGATRLSRQVPAQDGASSLTKGQLKRFGPRSRQASHLPRLRGSSGFHSPS
ncbi:MAG: hypothetical protein ACJ8D4_21930, partial [Xanthobacteraceae bacterium]